MEEHPRGEGRKARHGDETTAKAQRHKGQTSRVIALEFGLGCDER
jgi:hypothetical protein